MRSGPNARFGRRLGRSSALLLPDPGGPEHVGQPSRLDDDAHEVGPVRRAQLALQGGAIVRDGLRRQEDPPGDLAGRVAGRRQEQDVPLPVAQRGQTVALPVVRSASRRRGAPGRSACARPRPSGRAPPRSGGASRSARGRAPRTRPPARPNHPTKDRGRSRRGTPRRPCRRPGAPCRDPSGATRDGGGTPTGDGGGRPEAPEAPGCPPVFRPVRRGTTRTSARPGGSRPG